MNIINNVKYDVYDSEGNLVNSFTEQNADVACGRSNCAARLGDVAGSFFSESNKPVNFIAVTSDATAVGDADTGFGIVTFKIASATSKSLVLFATTEDTLRVLATINNAGADYTVNKAGLFYTATNPQLAGLVCAQIVTAFVLPSGGSVTITWDVRFT